jgi:hypothetical protein
MRRDNRGKAEMSMTMCVGLIPVSKRKGIAHIELRARVNGV